MLATLAFAERPTLDRYDELLARYVDGDNVRYDAWRESAADVVELLEIVAALEAVSPSALDDADRYALFINLYNAKTLQLVLQGNPAESIRDLSRKRFGFGVFFKKVIDFDGERISLDALEKRLRFESDDPRVHFAVNCASRSCPALLGEAYRGERLGAQLDAQSYAFLQRDDALRFEARATGADLVRLSKIFDWYAKDFGGAAGVRRFVRKYAPEDLREELGGGGFRITHMDYDWSLNRAD